MLTSLLTLKLVSMLAKDMINFEGTKRITKNLIDASRVYILGVFENENESGQENQHNAPPSTEYLVHNWLEALFAWFQMIILWHDPFISLCAISGLLTSFLLLTYFAPRFYATIIIAIFLYNLNKVWFRHIWPEIRVPPEEGRDEESRLDVDRWTHLHPHLMTLKELGLTFSNLTKSSERYLEEMLKLRREKPVAFCSLICSILSCTAYIGNRISDTSLLFCIIIAIVSAPGIYLYLLPKVVKEFLMQRTSLIILQSTQASNETQPESSFTTSLFEHLKHLSSQKINHLAEASASDEMPTNDEKEVTSTENLNGQDSCCNLIEFSNISSGDMSSTESTSLIDFEEEQQDGFVIL